MNRRSRSMIALAAACLLGLAACSASAPPTRLHTLMPVDYPARAAAAGAGPIAIVLEPITVPAQVDQPQWLVRLPDESVAVLEQERWASPLRDELRQALLEQLAARYGAVETRAPANASPPAVRIALDLRRFESIPGREARIDGVWTLVAGSGAPALRCEAMLREAASAGMPALAAAHRRAVARLAEAIGASLMALRGGGKIVCPPLESQ
ncbi:MAG: PqiC family protein [Caldimonas sp.]